MGQGRLWITDPRRSTCLVTVEEVRGERFRVDKALFAPRSNRCRHPQNHDKGTVWIDGEKRRLGAVIDDGAVWYTLRGTTPAVGATLQCELDRDTRDEASRAHTAMHLWLAALPDDAPPMTESPEVKGGGHVRFTHAWPMAPDVLATARQRLMQAVAADLVVDRFHMERAVARDVSAQNFQPPDPIPGPDVLPLVRIGDHCVPCDGSHVDRTSRITDVVVSHAAMGRSGFVVGLRVR